MLYAARCYWPGVTPADLEQVAARAAKAGLGTGRDEVAYLGRIASRPGLLVQEHSAVRP